MLKITSIKKGVVIDHIPKGEGIKIFKMLDLEESKHSKALIINVKSKKMGFKDIVKIENYSSIDFDVLSLISSDITINIIENEKIVKKIHPKIPKEVKNIIKCKNPRCITSTENVMNHFIHVSDKEYSCSYCEEVEIW